ncbi:MAG TPA: glycosyltransferase family 4 protein [Longimicrobiales bacterium]|nr:glycosyltransferase family 4 protein [Longimicrobiales bacterium]
MRLLVLNWQDRLNPQAGGAEIHLHEIFGRLARAGHEVSLLASGWKGAPARAEIDGIQVHRVGGRYTFNRAAPGYYRSALMHQGFDVMIEDLNKVPLFTPFWAQSPLVLLVHHLFGTTAFQEASLPLAAATWLLERPLGRVYRGIAVEAVSESTADDLVRRGFSRDRITVIPNGVDLEFFSPEPLGLRYPEPTVLYLGRLKRYKRVDLVIRAVARLRDQGVPARLVVAGTGDHGDALRALVDELRLGDRVEMPGFVSEDEKRSLFRRSWVHAFTSPKEGWGISNLEAAACGTATVASDSPGLRDSVVDGETGFLVPHGDVDALAARLGLLLGDPVLRDRLGVQARAFAERFTWDRSAAETEAHLERVLARAA